MSQLPAHEGHTPLPPAGPKPVPAGPSFPALTFTREWVVSPAGNDSNAGTREAPLKTITHAVAQAGPGEAVIVLAGTYAEKIDLGDAVKAGEPGRPITLQGEGNAQAGAHQWRRSGSSTSRSPTGSSTASSSISRGSRASP